MKTTVVLGGGVFVEEGGVKPTNVRNASAVVLLLIMAESTVNW